MADYIYLMQNRLAPAQWRALEAVREAARAHNMPVFLVGGAVRDLTSGSPVRDLDFAVQGDASALRSELESGGAIFAGESATLSSLYLTFRGGVRVEVGPTLSITYTKPGQPVTEPASILDDLRRRDFTANAMAVSLNEGSYGLLLDPLNGTADIENREFRLVSPYGFIEQPALLLRAARLSERLGWSLEERTESRYQNSKAEGHVEALSEAERGYELEEIFHEEDPVGALAHLEAEGWRDALSPSLRLTDGERGSLDDLRELVGQFEGQGLHPDPSAVIFPIVAGKLSEADRSALKGRFARQGFARQIDTLEARSKELAAQLTAKTAAAPSEAWKLLMAADPEVSLYLALHSRSGAVSQKIRAFLREWPQMRQKIPYALMQEMRITPDLPGYEQLLDDLFFALIDGKLETAEATRAFLEPYSPPAPPQVAVRRRPAKSARGRAKKVVEEPVQEEEDDTRDEREVEDGEGPTSDEAEDELDDEESDTEQSDNEVLELPSEKPSQVVPAMEAQEAAGTPANEIPESVDEPARKTPPAKKAVAADTKTQVPAKRPAPATKDSTATGKATGDRKGAAKAGGAAASAGSKGARAAQNVSRIAKPEVKPSAKESAKKGAPAPVKPAVKKAAPAKAAPAKSAKAPARKPPVPVKGKPPAKKAPAKKQVAAKKTAPVRRPAPPSKAVKKTAAKGRGR